MDQIAALARQDPADGLGRIADGRRGREHGRARGRCERPVASLRRPAFLALLLIAGIPAARGGEAPSPGALAGRIDHHIEARLRDRGIVPAPRVGDAEFLRRASLDLIGRIPTVAEARSFLDDGAADKRARVVRRLLDRPEYGRHFATIWRKVWLPQSETAIYSELSDGYEEWLREELIRNTPYDRLVAQQLTAPYLPPKPGKAQPPRAFLVASQFKPESLAANTTRAFLGLDLECAQCHNHPFARWTRDQFWETAAFFSRASDRSIRIEGTNRDAVAKLFTGEELRWPEARDEGTGRVVLASWITDEANPFFARNAVNRLWAQLFGLGLVEPLDDLSDENPGSDLDVLDEVAESFASGGFDLKALVEAIVLSRTYQRSSAGTVTNTEDEVTLFARMPVRALSGEQLHDSLLAAAGLPPAAASVGRRSNRGRFAGKFRAARAGLAERSVPQALTLFNGGLVSELTRPETSPFLRTLAASPHLDDAGRVDLMYLATLGRSPREDELGPLVRYLADAAEDPEGHGRALGNLFWALLNSTEFNTNH